MADEQQQLNRRITDTDDRMLDKILGYERATHDHVTNLSGKMGVIDSEQKHMIEKLDTLVSRMEFKPVQLLVYGMTAIILTSVMGALVALVLAK